MSLLARLAAAVRTVHTRPLAVLAGGFLIGAGVTLIQRYAGHLSETLGDAEQTYADLVERTDLLAAEYRVGADHLAKLRRELAETEDAGYPTPEDLDPLGRGEQAADPEGAPS